MAASTHTEEELERLGSSPQRGEENMRQAFSPDGRKAVWYSRTLTPYEEQNLNCSYGSLEAYGGDEMNQSANILQELQEVHFHNQKLREANLALRSRLETTEESCSELQRKAQETKDSIESLLQKQRVGKEQMSELREENKRLADNCFNLQAKETELEKEKQTLVKTVRDFQSEESDNKLTWRKAVASLEDEIEKLKMEINYKDIKIKKVEGHTDELIDKLLEENKNYSELHNSHKELQKAYQALKIEVADLERSKMTQVRGSVGEDVNQNLLSELRTVVNESRGPSPVCGRVSFETIEGLTMVESLSALIERIMTSNQSDPELLEKNVEEVRSQFDTLHCKVKWVMEAKKHSDQRAVSMGEKLKTLREENTQLKDLLQALREDYTELQADSTNASSEDTDSHRLIQVQNELELARAEVELMEFTSGRDKQRMIDLESMVSLLQKELELNFETSGLEEQMDLTHSAKKQRAKRKTSSVDSIAEVLGKGSSGSKRSRCSQCKREGVVKRSPHKTIPSQPINQGGLDDCVQKLQLQDLSHLDEISSSDEDVPDGESIEPLLESGYRTEASIGRSPVPSKPLLFPQSFPISTVIDALALDVFPQSFHPAPSPDRATFLSSSSTLLPLCPRCGYHLTPTQHQLLSSTEILYPKLFGAFDPLSLLSGDATSTTNLSDNLEDFFKNEALKSSLQLLDCGTQTEKVKEHRDESARLIIQEKASCHACIQTDLVVHIRNLAGTQTEENCLLKKSSKATSTVCTGPSTCSQGVSASVVLTEAQSQTVDADERCDTVLLDNEVDVIPQKASLTENSSSQTDSNDSLNSIAVNSIATQTLPIPNPTTSGTSFTFDLTIPVPSNVHPPALVKTSSSSSSSGSSIYLAPSSLPPHIISDDWDSDISADSPLFVSARSSPLVFGKQEGDTSKAVETLSFKPIGPSREKMEHTLPVCLDENSNKDIARHLPSIDRETVLNADKSTMRQRRSLERERKYSGVIQASNGDMVDLTTAEIDVSSISPSDLALNDKLLSESRKVSEKFENRRGRRFSPVKTDANDVVSDDSSPDSSPEPTKDDLSPRLIHQEERVGAEGDSDPEEEKTVSRKDSDEFDIKADILKAIGPIKSDATPKSALSSSKIRQDKKAKRPTFKLPMPELSEETCDNTSSSCSLPNGSLDTVSESKTDTCKMEVSSECSIKQEGEVKWEGGEGEAKQRKSSILSETLLKALGLKKGDGDKKAVLTEQEVEEKYNSLTFAFKTDRLTLEQRYKVQQHQRNVIEKNLQDEIRDHAFIVQSLERRCAEDEIARTDINRLKQHIDVIQYALVKLASKAEGFGAVQQEDRLSRATEIMVSHVENIKRNQDKEKTELSEAKRVLHENKILLRGNSITSLTDDSETGSRLRRASTLTNPNMKHSLHGIVRQKLMRKSPSLCDINDPDESKRRASVAAVLGFGSSPLGACDMRNRFASLATSALLSDRSTTSPSGGRGVLETFKEGETDKGDSFRFSDVKKKLSVSISNSNQSSELPPLSPIKPLTPPPVSPSLSSSSTKSPLLSSTPVIIRGDGEGKGNSGERSKTEEEIFQQGFEQGVRSQISQELDDLRDQQRALCENLEEIMEAAEDEDEDENEKNSETQPMLKLMQKYCKTIQWSKASRVGRLLLTGTLFILALISIITLVLPLERCSGGASMLSSSWEEVVRVLGPYTNIYHPRPPPI